VTEFVGGYKQEDHEQKAEGNQQEIEVPGKRNGGDNNEKQKNRTTANAFR